MDKRAEFGQSEQGGLLGALNNTFSNPMFQRGAAMFSAASSGDDIGKGFMMGQQAVSTQEAQKLRRKQILEQIAAQKQQASKGPTGGAIGEQYQIAKGQGYKGTLLDFMKARNPQQQPQAGSNWRNVGGSLIAPGPDGKPRVIYQPKKEPTLAERLLFPDGNQQPQQQSQERGFIKQSFEGAPQGDPNIIKTASAAVPQDGQDVVNIPGVGKMPRDRAEKARAAFILEGNKAAADLFDQALKPDTTMMPGEAANNEIDERLINAKKALGRLSEIRRLYKPEYQTTETKVGMAITDILDRFQYTRGDVSDDDRKALSDYRQFRLSAIDNINRYIQEITGAQMSEAEAIRLRQGIPDAGDGLWGGDGPTSFSAKLDQTERLMRLSTIRFSYMKRNGFNGDGEALESEMPLHKMEQIINQRSKKLYQDAVASGADQSTALRQTQKALRAEFGMDI
jgi:hypothetical protein